MAAGIKKFNWVKRPSSWEFAQAWRSQRSAMTQKFLEEGETARTAFANAQYNHLTGIGTLRASGLATGAEAGQGQGSEFNQSAGLSGRSIVQ